MTEMMYMHSISDCYEKEFEACVKKVDNENGWIELDRTLFYPEGGGQPTDKGKIEWSGGSSDVTLVKKKGIVKHFLDGQLPNKGETVQGCIDWGRRYSHMKMHTSQHLLSAVIWNRFQSATVGNQIHESRSHIDFHPAGFSMDELKEIEKDVNQLIGEGHNVYSQNLERSRIESIIEKERVDLSRLPPNIRHLRTIFIGDKGKIDICPCAGTHVRSISELGEMNIIKRKSKGSGKIRVEYILR